MRPSSRLRELQQRRQDLTAQINRAVEERTQVLAVIEAERRDLLEAEARFDAKHELAVMTKLDSRRTSPGRSCTPQRTT